MDSSKAFHGHWAFEGCLVFCIQGLYEARVTYKIPNNEVNEKKLHHGGNDRLLGWDKFSKISLTIHECDNFFILNNFIKIIFRSIAPARVKGTQKRIYEVTWACPGHAGAINRKMVLLRFVYDRKMITFGYGKRYFFKNCLSLQSAFTLQIITYP